MLNPKLKDVWIYRNAIVKEVYDGDTYTVDIDLGFDIWAKKQKIRLFGLDTPEVRGKERPQGLIVRDLMRKMILGKKIEVHTLQSKKGKYGRWLGVIYLEDENINEFLINNGHAKKAFY